MSDHAEDVKDRHRGKLPSNPAVLHAPIDWMEPSSVRVVFVTAPPDKAPELARALVEQRLAACINILENVRSTYRWEGTVEVAEEALMIIKTTKAQEASLRATVLALHPYDVPEFIVLPVESGHEPYLRWVHSEVTQP